MTHGSYLKTRLKNTRPGPKTPGFTRQIPNWPGINKSFSGTPIDTELQKTTHQKQKIPKNTLLQRFSHSNLIQDYQYKNILLFNCEYQMDLR